MPTVFWASWSHTFRNVRTSFDITLSFRSPRLLLDFQIASRARSGAPIEKLSTARRFLAAAAIAPRHQLDSAGLEQSIVLRGGLREPRPLAQRMGALRKSTCLSPTDDNLPLAMPVS